MNQPTIKNPKPNSRTFFFGAILTAIFFVIISASFKTYESEVTILVMTKSDAAFSHEQILNSLAELPKTFNFYQRLLNDNPEIRESNTGKSDSERKQLWNQMLTVKRSPKNSSIIKISIFADSENGAEKLAFKTARTFFDTASSYYNVKTDVDMRLVDGPLTESSLSSWPWMLLVSLILGFLMAYILQNTMSPFLDGLAKLSAMLKEKSEEYKLRKVISLGEDVGSGEINVDSKDVHQERKPEPATESKETQEISSEKTQSDKELETLNKIIQQDIYPNFPEMPVAPKKSEAPDNLPIGDSSFFMEENPQQSEEVKEEEVEEKQPEEDLNREPTPEELKRRLNQLLKGKL